MTEIRVTIRIEPFENSDLLFAYSDDIPGLSVTARSLAGLEEELRRVIPALLKAQGKGEVVAEPVDPTNDGQSKTRVIAGYAVRPIAA
tara:strand:+ start:1041 stop:1304 length:264 start_codon:yes stop_codon:yes gene_type:complete